MKKLNEIVNVNSGDFIYKLSGKEYDKILDELMYKYDFTSDESEIYNAIRKRVEEVFEVRAIDIIEEIIEEKLKALNGQRYKEQYPEAD